MSQDNNGAKQETTEDNIVTRRSAIKGIGAVGGLALAGGAGLLSSTGSAAAENSFGASNAVVQTPDGEVSQVYIIPEGDLTWENFDEEIKYVHVSIDSQVLGPNGEERLYGWKNVFDNQFTLGTESGLGGFTHEQLGVIMLYGGDTGRPTSMFEADDDGETRECVIELRINVRLLNGSQNLADPADVAKINESVKFRATNTNLPATATANMGIDSGMTAASNETAEE